MSGTKITFYFAAITAQLFVVGYVVVDAFSVFQIDRRDIDRCCCHRRGFVPASSRKAALPSAWVGGRRFVVNSETALFDEIPKDGTGAEGNWETNVSKRLFERGDDVTIVNGEYPSDEIPANGMAVNGYTPSANGMEINGYSAAEKPVNGMKINGIASPPSVNGLKESDQQEISKGDPSTTAPEVNKWTALMADFTNAVTHRLRKEVTVAEGTEILNNHLKDMTDFDNAEVEKYWDKIMPNVSYLGTQSVAKIKMALRVAYRAHRAQRRKSGEPFIIHPVEVSLLLAGLRMDAETVMAGLLHDTVEDTDLTFTQVEAMFGNVVRSIVEGETKVSKLPKLAFEDYADEQAENLRQMFVAMSDDYRIIIVKLADRLHNMRTLRFMKPEKQRKISRETLDIFAPLAHRMGIWQFKSELEDTAFMYLYPEEYKRLNRRLRRHQTQFRETLDHSQEVLRRTLETDPTLKGQDMDVKVYGRTKELYSLWYKMETKANRNLDHVADVVALRVILSPKRENIGALQSEPESDRGVWLCYHVLGLVQHLPGFQPVPTRVKDYISFPKPNGYQSLHTALMLNGQTVEVQIRTEAMHRVAEYGMASHWAYTDEKKRRKLTESSNELYNTPWLSSIKEWQKDVVCSRDFVECVRRELLGKRVFVFLRNGKILNLARGATAIDAAFGIHTEVGLNMHGVEINGKPVPFSYELQNGDVVNILTGEGKPQTDWMRCAKSRSTRSKLRSYFRSKQRESHREAGEILLMDFLRMHQGLLQELSFLEGAWSMPSGPDDLATFLPGKTPYDDVDELLVEIGKRHDRNFLRNIVSKLFLVPLSEIVQAEQNASVTMSRDAAAAVRRTVTSARESAAALDPAASEPLQNSSSLGLGEGLVDDNDDPIEFKSSSLDGNSVEFADPDYLCDECLPIRGDDIIGTRPIFLEGQRNDFVTTVHRCGCVIAQRALNRNRASATDSVFANNVQSGESNRAGSAVARIRETKRFTKQNSFPAREEVPVKLRWSDLQPPHGFERESFLAEVVIVAEDRKMLLADCSEVVSHMSEIVLAGTSVNEEHCTLVFLVKVTGLEHLQNLMDSLRGLPSVMSVERKFGSDLL